jgi:uncharacterized protein (DUF2235 family)
VGKNIVICCDGTGNDFDVQYRNTNVVRLYSLLETNSREQVAYYNPGVGTMAAPDARSAPKRWIQIIGGLAFGYGVTANVEDAYRFLMQTFRDGDRVFMFGFSRGAFTVRALAGMLHAVGLLRPDQENLIRYAFRVYSRRDGSVAAQFRKVFGRDCKTHFIGAWDTVASVGIIPGLRRKFPDTRLNPEVKTGRQALALDEKRSFFRPSLWCAPYPRQDIRQVWFAGVHSDIGGGYPERDLANAPLIWMIEEALDAGLKLRIPNARHYYKMLPLSKIHNSLLPWWWVCGWRTRTVDKDAPVHDTVDSRVKDKVGYRPKNLFSDGQVRSDLVFVAK